MGADLHRNRLHVAGHDILPPFQIGVGLGRFRQVYPPLVDMPATTKGWLRVMATMENI